MSCFGGGAGGRGEEDRFQSLLQELASEHAQAMEELSSLRLRYAALERVRKFSGASTPPREDEPDVSASCSFITLPGQSDTDEAAGQGSTSVTQLGKPDQGPYDAVKTSAHSATAERAFSKRSVPAFVAPALEARTVWLKSVELRRLQTSMNLASSPGDGAAAALEPGETAGRVQGDAGLLRHLISFPSSPRRLAWDLLGAALIFYDLFAIPLLFAFEPPEGAALGVANKLLLAFWTLDILASLQVGYTKDGVTYMDPRSIAARYARTWLAVDLMVVVPDWAFTLAALGSSGIGQGSSVRILRVVRLFRMVRLLRLFKLRRVVQSLYELVDSEYVGIFLNIGKMMLILLVINHYLGCAWFLIGTAGGLANSWVREHGFDDADWTYQYSTSFHWAITQFTPASMHVQPQNVVERTFAIAVVVFALVVFSYVVGSITGSLSQLRGMQEGISKQLWKLRSYLRQNSVSITLSVRVQRYLEHALKAQQARLSRDKIPILSSLSEQLQAELEYEVYVPQLSVHPLFKCLRSVSSVTMGRVAHRAISRKELATNDRLFIPGESATHASFVRAGRLQYTRFDSTLKEHREWVDNAEDWIAEQVLWLSAWNHLGSLMAVRECELLLVDPVKFSEIVHLNPPAFQQASTYARNFLEWARSVHIDSMSDIWQGEDVGPMVRRLMGHEDHADERTTTWGAWGGAHAVRLRGSHEPLSPVRLRGSHESTSPVLDAPNGAGPGLSRGRRGSK